MTEFIAYLLVILVAGATSFLGGVWVGWSARPAVSAEYDRIKSREDVMRELQ